MAKVQSSGGSAPVYENTEWKKDLDKFTSGMPEFKNRPLVGDLRK